MARLDELERENAALRRALRLLHDLANLVREADEPDATAYAVLTGVTAGVGLGLNRAMLFVPSADDPNVLIGAAAVGPADRVEADRVWRAIEAERPDLETLYEVGLRRADARGALDDAVRARRVDLRAPARSPIAACMREGLEPEDDLAGLFDLPTTIAAPMRVRSELVGVLAADNAFTGVVPDATTRLVLGLVADHAGRALESARRFARVASEARTDALTGLEARRVGLELLHHMLANGRALGLVLIDLDHFKRINDTHGHPVGDAVLAAVGERVRALLSRGMRAFRYGGEELAVIVPGADVLAARAIGEQIRAAIRGLRVRARGVELAITASVGVASSLDHEGGAPALVRAADDALLHAKSRGRDRVEIG
ncbi:sensor domain-containing diguanylate cyclase [Sandaracinus amylolyticus]|uniref:GGDEF domain-containing protein n=1 Tax=Sandaracinus amylolyticus TaxID=927083 RepID=UPI001F44463B|nr:GGDEF domain-containing protein [Sandaracinus amylolyticus]UJR82690.1 Hypothetical protein I5071_47550 [Sandaracinus amylolyticus]